MVSCGSGLAHTRTTMPSSADPVDWSDMADLNKALENLGDWIADLNFEAIKPECAAVKRRGWLGRGFPPSHTPPAVP